MTFFTHDKSFYRSLFSMLAMVALQNLVAYSVNMADNIMLGNYSQDALSGAATVNQIFFLVQQFAIAIGNALVVLAAQYWGQKRVEPIRRLTGIACKLAMLTGVLIVALCAIFPRQLIGIFTDGEAIIEQGTAYLQIVQYTFLLFLVTNVWMAALRAVETVQISFYISVVSLIVNVSINYILIFGKFGAPELGVRGAAIGTLVARILELLIVLWYLYRKDTKIHLLADGFWKRFLQGDRLLRADYTKTYIPIAISLVLWGVSVPMQTAILGHLSDDAIAANSVATTFYQYLKVIVVAMSSTSAVMIGNAIGRGDEMRIRSDARTLSCIDVAIGVILGLILMALRQPLLSMYHLTGHATELALHLIVIMGFIMMGMSYQMPVSMGIIQGAGDAGFTMRMNMISTWLIVMPLSFMAAFWWKWPVEWVVIVVQSDQVFKCVPTFIHFVRYNWIRKLTRE
ncbi:MAG: MATE family efflux transporter [Agathobacter sp.]|uniref:MATE family efflux transporter n=1 Tax=Agathobacter sp. TaxID=2021311 RepID=UPI00258FD4DC|nr:MATE family efflux transporter [Agathobacter sp.]MCR5677575.1 MATE family efflux transporter [Agathobacter sp.]